MDALKYITVALLTLTILPSSFAANWKQRLAQVDHKIISAKQFINEQTTELSQQQAALKQLELNLSNQIQKLNKTRHKIRKLHETVYILQTQYRHYEDTIKQTKQDLTQNLQKEYEIGQKPRIKWLLEEKDITRSQRMLTYMKYLNKQRTQQIEQLKTNIERAKQNLDIQSQKIARLQYVKQKQQHQFNRYKKLESKRKLLLNQLTKSLSKKTVQLKQLLANKARLQKTLKHLPSGSLYFKSIGKPFSSLKHHLQWPTHGELIKKYGNKIQHSQLRWNGVLFAANSGQPIYAIAEGKVIFANWLPGYGLLVIIYHGQGYMTLYGRNQSILIKVGDIVHAGDEIATVGNTGGYTTPALYFEIRQKSQPLNPLQWLSHH